MCFVQETTRGSVCLNSFCKTKLTKLCGNKSGHLFWVFCLARIPLLLETAPNFILGKLSLPSFQLMGLEAACAMP